MLPLSLMLKQCPTKIYNLYKLLIKVLCGFFKRISIEGALLSQATKLGSNEALLNSRKKVPLEPSVLESQFQESIEPAYSSDQDENLQTSATEQIDADDEEESEQVGKRGEKIKSSFPGEDGRGIKMICKTARRQECVTSVYNFLSLEILLFRPHTTPSCILTEKM